jgi:hypothetical protein
MKHLLLAFIVCLGATDATAEKSCTQMEAYAAETVTDYLDSWTNVYHFFKQFRHCYDGSIAEGAADRIQLLWSSHWSTLPQLIALTAKDAEFKDFIWERVDDEIWPADRFALVLRNARTKCPRSGGEFCRVVIKSSVRN